MQASGRGGVATPIAQTEQPGWESIPMRKKQNLLEEPYLIGLRAQAPHGYIKHTLLEEQSNRSRLYKVCLID